MGKELDEIAKDLKKANKKVQLIYAFNGAGKTRLSRSLKKIIAPESMEEIPESSSDFSQKKLLYYSAFTEDLFYWNNDLDFDANPKLIIQPNLFTDWVFIDQGQEFNIAKNFQKYTNSKLTPNFNIQREEKNADGTKKVIRPFSEVTFSVERGTSESTGALKISKGEESNFIWCVFLSVFEEVLSILQEPDVASREDNQFNELEYVFIDDPVTSLDENHLIELAVHLADLIKSDKSNLKYIITTHNSLFYNVLYNEFQIREDSSNYRPKDTLKYRLHKNEDGTLDLLGQDNDRPFLYHLFLLSELENAIANDKVQKYHFVYLRNILEKSASFLGHKTWSGLLAEGKDKKPDAFAARLINLSSHSKHTAEEVSIIKNSDKENLARLVGILKRNMDFVLQDGR